MTMLEDALREEFDDKRDLLLERRLAATPAQIWRAWTDPAHLKQWFAPKPVEVTEAVIEPWAGGRFRTVMKLPDGHVMDGGDGCILLAEPERRLVFTDALGRGWRPNAAPFFTAVITIAADGAGAAYSARAIHGDPEACARHAEMGFHEGWGTVADQLGAFAAGL